jgi:hypothetical protein
MAIELCRINRGYKESIEILKSLRDPRTRKDTKRTPYEGVPKSFSSQDLAQSTS